MNDFEYWSLVLGGVNLLLIIIGFAFAFFQVLGARRELRVLNRHHADNHDWNRRVAAQEAVAKFNYSILASPLQISFDFLNAMDPISVTKIDEELKANANLQNELHELLNYYEGLARGINQGILDETVVKIARRTEMQRCERAFRDYIEKRRGFSPRAWLQLSYIAGKWAGEETTVELRPTVDEVSVPIVALSS